jgi:hypothetical protein
MVAAARWWCAWWQQAAAALLLLAAPSPPWHWQVPAAVFLRLKLGKFIAEFSDV